MSDDGDGVRDAKRSRGPIANQLGRLSWVIQFHSDLVLFSQPFPQKMGMTKKVDGRRLYESLGK